MIVRVVRVDGDRGAIMPLGFGIAPMPDQQQRQVAMCRSVFRGAVQRQAIGMLGILVTRFAGKEHAQVEPGL